MTNCFGGFFQTGIWTDLCNIAASYINILRVCLSMSKSYYGSELKRLHEDRKVKAKGKKFSHLT